MGVTPVILYLLTWSCWWFVSMRTPRSAFFIWTSLKSNKISQQKAVNSLSYCTGSLADSQHGNLYLHTISVWQRPRGITYAQELLHKFDHCHRLKKWCCRYIWKKQQENNVNYCIKQIKQKKHAVNNDTIRGCYLYSVKAPFVLGVGSGSNLSNTQAPRQCLLCDQK